MKKTYTTPEYELILLDGADVMTASGGGIVTDGNGNVDLPDIPW